MFLYIVVSQDTSVDNAIHKIICIKDNVDKAREHVTFYRKLYQFNMVTQSFAEVLP